MFNLFKDSADEFRRLNFKNVTHPDDIALNMATKNNLSRGDSTPILFFFAH